MAQEGRPERGKKIMDCRTDFISALPRGVIDLILERLPLCDAARMSVQSHKWLQIWRTIHKLAFDAHFFLSVLQNKMYVTHQFIGIVSKILFYHKDNLRKFHLYIPAVNSPPDVNQWLSYLSGHYVSEISIENKYKNYLTLSSDIFSCANLEKLKLHKIIISPPGNFEAFRKMTWLELDQTNISDKSFAHLIQSCPLLETLILMNFSGLKNIVIDAPKLCCLTVDGASFKSLDVSGLANLTSVHLGVHNLMSFCPKAGFLCGPTEPLGCLSQLQNLVFAGYFCKVLYKASLLPTRFEKVRYLELSSIHLNDQDDFSSVISAIKSCPAIERLHIFVTASKDVKSELLHYNPDFAALKNLSYADFTVCNGSTTELKLIEFLLEYSPILRKFSITSLKKKIENVLRPTMMNQLLGFCRASPKAKVVLPGLVPAILVESNVSASAASCEAFDEETSSDEDYD